ncbi:MAG TPA: glycosyltransferase 87 family protein [Blastocatellia bacterium]|nr:glycosyltransferase 87 family protein [Blastocatellia bacterium]
MSSARFYSLLFGVGYLALAVIHWLHSWGPISDGYVFADLGDDSESNPMLEICQTVTLFFLFSVYVFGLVNWERWRFKTREVVIMLTAPSLLAWSALPANSTDLFAYISMGRLAAIYQANPYLHTYSEFGDEFSSFLHWDVTMPYGPVLLPFFAVAGWVSKYSVVASVFFLKLIWLLTYYGSCWALYRILQIWKRSDAAYGLFLFALNPLVLLEQLANGHNDGLMIFWGLLSILALQRERSAWAVVLALLSALVKLPGIFFLSVIGVYLLWRREWRGLIFGSLGGAALLLVLKIALFPTTESIMSLTNPASDTKNSLHELLLDVAGRLCQWLGASVSYDTLYSVDRRVFAVLFLAFCLWRIRQIGRVRHLNVVVSELAAIFLAMLIGYATWFFPWYVTWLIPLAALVDSAHLKWVIVVFSWTVLALYSFPNFLVEEAPLNWLWAMLRIVIAHGIPLALILSLEKSGKVWSRLEKSGEMMRKTL